MQQVNKIAFRKFMENNGVVYQEPGANGGAKCITMLEKCIVNILNTEPVPTLEQAQTVSILDDIVEKYAKGRPCYAQSN